MCWRDPQSIIQIHTFQAYSKGSQHIGALVPNWGLAAEI